MLALKKLMVFLLMFAIFVVLREVLFFIKAFIKGEKLDMTVKREIILASALSYIFTIIFTGFQLF